VSVSDPVHLMFVHDEGEAELVVGLLRSSDIPCEWRMTTQGLAGVGGASGPREILVDRKDLETAQALLAAQTG
jgi:Putative prokaryotic signal transducing protein